MHLIILSLWNVHFFSDMTVGIRHFLKSLIRPTSRSVHEIFLGWAEQALDATNTIPADDDLGKAVMVTDRHDWIWNRLRVKTVSSGAASSTIVENNLVPFGSALHDRDRRTITELGKFSCQAIRQCWQCCQGWTYYGTLVETDVSHDFRSSAC